MASITAALVVSVVAGGCGGGDGTTAEETATPLSKQEFLAELEEIEREVGPAWGAINDAKTPEEVSAALEGLATAQREAADSLEQLTPPTDAQAGVDQVVAAARGLADELDTVAAMPDLTKGEAKQELEEPVGKLEQAITELEDQGYRTG